MAGMAPRKQTAKKAAPRKAAARKPRKATGATKAATPGRTRERTGDGDGGADPGKTPGTPSELVAGKPKGVADKEANDLRRLMAEQQALQAVEMVLAGASTEQIATRMEVDPSTVRRWLRLPGAQSAIAEAHTAQVRRVVHMSGSAAGLAVQTLTRAMREADRWSDRIRAAEAVMRAFGMSQMTEAVAETGKAEAAARQELSVTLGQMAERARQTVIDVGVVEPVPDEPDVDDADDEGDGRRLSAVD